MHTVDIVEVGTQELELAYHRLKLEIEALLLELLAQPKLNRKAKHALARLAVLRRFVETLEQEAQA